MHARTQGPRPPHTGTKRAPGLKAYLSLHVRPTRAGGSLDATVTLSGRNGVWCFGQVG